MLKVPNDVCFLTDVFLLLDDPLCHPSAESPPVAAPPPPSVKAAPVASVAPQDASSLVNLLSKVDVSPADLLSALSKVQGLESIDGENLFFWMFNKKLSAVVNLKWQVCLKNIFLCFYLFSIRHLFSSDELNCK